MEIKQSGSQPSAKGPAEFFTGNVRIDPLFPATDPSCVSAGLVTFEPGARTAWHTHPLGQRLIVTAGCGWVQCWGGPKSVVWSPIATERIFGAVWAAGDRNSNQGVGTRLPVPTCMNLLAALMNSRRLPRP